ncbi:hypothetical protein PPTG_23517 [Phytophthora nicotianae INRA-310]|uniref:Uncharacterized protein n=2 Tax=Phytophthora nicotianae TaxID=4792 RepID=W2PZJ5_PHYN3|nr:hypothetical protein PPTG_23517 [Phytophthora nicotianae INRA-310]ETN05460.1 hypothetical protein PPTG_23517 [Phytophthora nicotianae INRA-310]
MQGENMNTIFHFSFQTDSNPSSILCIMSKVLIPVAVTQNKSHLRLASFEHADITSTRPIQIQK